MFGANGQPLPTCIAWHCTVNIQPPHPFCKLHWLRVPQWIRQAIVGERDDIRRTMKKDAGPTPHLLQLLNIAVEKELQRRMKEDPSVVEAVKKENEEFLAKQRAAVSPILNAENQQQLSPKAAPLPPAIQVRP